MTFSNDGVIDAYCVAKFQECNRGEVVSRIDHLTTTLEAAGIGRAWVTSDLARGAEPQQSDELLVEACRERSRHLHPLLTIVPSRREADPLQRLREESPAREGSPAFVCRAVRLCPGSSGHRYPLVDWMVSPIPEYCERESATLVLDYARPTGTVPWPEVIEFSRSFPRVAMMLVGLDLGDAVLDVALDITSNLIIQVSGAVDPTLLNDLLKRAGNYRFVYGSGGALGQDPSSGPSNSWALIDEDDRHAVLTANAAALEAGAWQEVYL